MKQNKSYTGMLNKRTFIRRAYKAIQPLTSHKYYDDDWTGVKNVVAVINEMSEDGVMLKGARYEGTVGQDGYSKVYHYLVIGVDPQKPIDIQIIASFCGTVAEPMSAYDLTVLMN